MWEGFWGFLSIVVEHMDIAGDGRSSVKGISREPTGLRLGL